MPDTKPFRERWKEVAAVFLKLGAMSYGGSAMLGIMQAIVLCRWRLPPLPLILGAGLLGIAAKAALP